MQRSNERRAARSAPGSGRARARRLVLPLACVFPLFLTGLVCGQRDPDVNDDGGVDILDVSLVSSCFGADPANDCRCASADIDRNGRIDQADLELVREMFGARNFDVAPEASACTARDPDVNDDGVVNVRDVSRVASCLGSDPVLNCKCLSADVNGDWRVDASDLASVVDGFGTSGYPVAPPDATAPALAIDSPADAAVVTGAAVELAGHTDDPGALVLVDGERVALPPSPTHSFRTRVALQPGANEITVSAADASCNETHAVVHVTRAQSQGAARGVATGTVFDAASGRPLAGARVELLSLDGTAPAAPLSTQSDARGRFRLSSAPGRARFRVTREGYTESRREASVGAGLRSDVLDAELTPLAAATPVSSLLGAQLRSPDGAATLELPPGALPADASLALGVLAPHGVAAPPPRGWSVRAAAGIAPAGLAYSAPAALEMVLGAADAAAVAGGVAARFDPVSAAWIALGAPSPGATPGAVRADVAGSGQFAFLAPDAPPWTPPAAVAGQPLAGAAPPASAGALAASVVPTPRILFADPAALARVEMALAGAPLPSGAVLALEREESLQFLDGGVLLADAFTENVPLQAGVAADGTPQLRGALPVGPTAAFDPLALGEGAVVLRVRPSTSDGEPRGLVVDAAGGSAPSADGTLQILVPAGAASGEVPVGIAPLAADRFAPLLGSGGVAIAAAFAIDLRGASLTRSALVSLPTPPGVGVGESLVAARVDVQLGRSALVAVGLTDSRSGRTTVAADPLATGAPLPGLLQDGSHLLLRVPGGLAFASGRVLAQDGGPRAGALVRAEGLPYGAVAGADGRYALPLPPGAHRLVAVDPETHDEASAQLTLAAAGQSATADLSLSQTPPHVVGSDPVDGATAVRLASVLRVDFSEPIAPASVAADALVLMQGGAPAAGDVSLSPDRLSLRLVPAAPLGSDLHYDLHVSAALADDAGNALGHEVVVGFQSEDRTQPAAPAPGQVTASVPGVGPNATSAIAAGPGTAEPGGLAVVVDLATGVTASFAPNPDGSFSGSIAAARTDRLELRLRDAAGNETSVALGPFHDPDGRTVVGAAGGRVEGAGGAFVDVPPGALPDGTAVLVQTIQQADLALAPPPGFPFAGGMRLDLGGVEPLAALDVGVAAPADAAPGDQVVVATDVATPTGRGWTVVERAHLENGRYVTASPPFPGITHEGTYGFLRSTLGCVSYVEVTFSVTAGYLITPLDPSQSFVYPTTDASVAVMPAVCNANLDIRVVDTTGAPVLGATRRAPPVADQIAPPDAMLTDDRKPPEVLRIAAPSGGQPRQLEADFSEPVDPDSAKRGFLVVDDAGNRVAGRVDLRAGNEEAVFLPDVPFQIGKSYRIILFGIRDPAGNVLQEAEQSFTPFDPGDPLAQLGADPVLGPALRKCTPTGSCSTSVREAVQIGDVLFLANGLASNGESYTAPGDPKRLIAIDVSDPSTPHVIGFHATTTNPLAVAAAPAARLTLPDGTPFAGDLLLVAGGGKVPGGELAGKIEAWDVSTCTRHLAVSNCLANGLRGWKLLSTPAETFPQEGVPPEDGVPQQLAVLQQHVPGGDDVLFAYVVVAAIGLEAADVAKTFNLTTGASRGPDGIRRGEFVDVAVSDLRGVVAAIDLDPGSGQSRLDVLAPDLGSQTQIPLPTSAARLSLLENFAVDLDGDGNLGPPEDADGDPTKARDEFFDLALLGSGPLDSGCSGSSPCGALLVVDISPLTALAHAGSASVLSRIPLPGPAFDVEVDGAAETAYVEMRGAGLAIVDLSSLELLLKPGVQVAAVESAAQSLLDLDHNGRDDRVLGVTPKSDVFAGQLGLDAARGLAFVNGSVTGLDVVRVADRCTDLVTDFQSDDPVVAPTRASIQDTDALLQENKADLQAFIDRAAKDLIDHFPGIALDTGNGSPRVPVLEQGSGACFWRDGFPRSCDAAFEFGKSDHDLEFYVPQDMVEAAQGELDAFIADPANRAIVEKIDDFSFFAFSRDALEASTLTIGTPQNKSGDADGDLALGRQTLLLLWILEGEWVPGHEGRDSLDQMLENMRVVRPIPGDDHPIPVLEGYEWSRLQEFNFYHKGVQLRFEGACDRPDDDPETPDPPDRNDPDRLELGLLGDNCDSHLRGAGKAAIRSVMARMVALQRAGEDLLPPNRQSYSSASSTTCLTGVADVRNPPTDPAGFARKKCGSFEEYILSLAVQAVAAGRGSELFPDVGVDTLFRFYCTKVGARCASFDPSTGQSQLIVGPYFSSDADVGAYLATVRAFVEKTQEMTLDAYQEVDNDTVAKVGNLPFRTGIDRTCAEAGLGQQITPDQPRKLLRQCNLLIVDKKVNGTAPSVSFSPPHVQLVADKDKRAALLKQLGAKGGVVRNLRVRARNNGPNDVTQAPLRLFEGDGASPDAWAALGGDQTVDLTANSSQVLDKKVFPPEEKPQPVYPLVFDLRGQSPPPARALAFAIDPGHAVSERLRTNNSSGFFYRRVDAPTHGGDPIAPIDTKADAFCLQAPSGLQLLVSIQDASTSGTLGAQLTSVTPYQQLLFTYRVRNTSQQPIQELTIARNGEAVVTIPALAPGTSETRTERFVPTELGRLFVRATASGIDPKGNTVEAQPRVAAVDVVDLDTFGVQLFDDSPLSRGSHPFSRFNLTHDDQGKDIPIMGAATDGDGQLGGGRIRIEIDRLKPGVAAAATLTDAEVTGATEGLGELALYGDSGPVARGSELTGLAPLSNGTSGKLTLYYAPPTTFVRDPHRADDFPKAERLVRVRVRQDGVGSTSRTIHLRRPPILLLHGFLGSREVWNLLQPLVPASGMSANRYAPTPGYDGRFDLYAVGDKAARDSFAVLSQHLETDVANAIGAWRPGYSLARFDTVGFSTGGPLWFVLLKNLSDAGRISTPPMRKMISFAGALNGTDLASKLTDIRDTLPNIKLDESLRYDSLRPDETGLPVGVSVQLKPDLCARSVKLLGLNEAFLLRGAVDDLRTASPSQPDIGALLSRFDEPPAVHFLTDDNQSNSLGVAPHLVFDMWVLLGQLCNLSPDASTVETTQAAKDLTAILTAVVAIRGAAAEQGAERLKSLEKTLEKTVNSAIKREIEPTTPTPVFTGVDASNDRVVPELSQRGLFAPGASYVTPVSSGDSDHLLFHDTPGISANACVTPAPQPPDFKSDAPDLNGDGRPDVTCRLLQLLEAEPKAPLFLGGLR